MKSLTLHNYILAPLINFISVPLAPQLARPRNRIIKLLSEKGIEFESNRQELIATHGKRDKNKQLIIDPATNSYVFKKPEKFAEDYQTLSHETVTLDILPSNKADFVALREIMFNLKAELDVNQTVDYIEICEALEAMDAKPKK